MEASDEEEEEIFTVYATWDGCLVSDVKPHNMPYYAYMGYIVDWDVNSAGICAAVKTSKVPITVNAKTDITCKPLFNVRTTPTH